MQKKRQYLQVVSQIVCLLVVTAMLGCSDTPKRVSGKKLRAATREAKKHYDKAQSLLSNYDDGYNKPEVLSALGTAEKILTNTLRENDKNGDPEDTPHGELVNARKMLGMVYQLRGKCNLWKIDAITREVGIQENKTHTLLTKVQALNAGAVSYRQSLLENGDITRRLSKAKTDQKTFTDQTVALNSKIKTQTENIKVLEKKIQSLSVQSASLRKESAVNVSREDSLKKLREAQNVEKKIIDNEVILARNQRDLDTCKKDMVLLQIKLEEAKGQLQGYQARSLSVEKREEKRKSDLIDRENEIKTCWENIVVSQKTPLNGYPGVSQRSLGENCQLAMTLTRQAKGDFDKARSQFAAAGRIDGNANGLLIDDEAEALVGKAIVMTRLMNLHRMIQSLSDRARMVWKSMGDMQMSIEPVVPEITKFLLETGDLESEIANSYRQAVKLRETAVRKTREAKSRLQYQKALADTYETYAVSLRAAGNIDQAAAEMKKAKEINTKISKSN